MSFLPLIKAGHDLPINFQMECEVCHEKSLAVNFTSEFFVKCCNPWCPARNVRQTVSCVLKHRSLQKTNLKFSLGPDRLVTTTDEGRADPLLDEDLNKPEAVWGPYEPCAGYLGWDPDLPAKIDTWLVCSVCLAAFKAYICATDGVGGSFSRHNQFRARTDRDGHISILSSWSNEPGLLRLPTDSLMWITEIRWQSRQIRESEVFA